MNESLVFILHVHALLLLNFFSYSITLLFGAEQVAWTRLINAFLSWPKMLLVLSAVKVDESSKNNHSHFRLFQAELRDAKMYHKAEGNQARDKFLWIHCCK